MPGLNDIFRNFIGTLVGGDNAMLRGKDCNSGQMTQEMYDAIAKKAYELYVDRNFEHGHDREDWLEAERIVRRSMR
jgi:hypothetical protein